MKISPRVRNSVIVFFLSFGIFAAFSGNRIKQQTHANHFTWLADAYLHGRLELRVPPRAGGDWAGYETITLESGEELNGNWVDRRAQTFRTLDEDIRDLEWAQFPFSNGGIPGQCSDDLPPAAERDGYEQQRCARHFVSFPPGPAVMMMPGVAVWGLEFNDMLFTLFFSALASALLFSFLSRLREEEKIFVSKAHVIILTIAFVLGTNFLWCSVIGRVWFTAQMTALTFTIAYMHAAFDAKYPLLAGLFLAGAFACRTPVLFSVVFFAGFFFFPGGKLRKDFGKKFFIDGIKFALVPLLVGCILMWMNEVRFHSVSKFGHTFIDFAQNPRISEFGLFHYRYLGLNLTAMFTLFPRILTHYPYVIISAHGLALWISSPVILWAVWPKSPRTVPFRYRGGVPSVPVSQSYYRWIFWLTILAVAIPHVFYQSSGWGQAGYRYALDYFPYLFAMIAFSNHRLKPGIVAAIIFGIMVNVFAAVTFERHRQFYQDYFLEAHDTAQGI